MTIDTKYITTLTRLSASERDKLALVWRKLSEEQKISIEEITIQIINQNRFEMDKTLKSEFYYSCRLLAIKKYINTLGGFSKKQDMTKEQLENIQDLRIQSIRSKKKKDRSTRLCDIVRIRYEELKNLKGKGLSWRDIANYLAQFTKTQIHYTYLRKIYKEAEYEHNDKNRECN